MRNSQWMFSILLSFLFLFHMKLVVWGNILKAAVNRIWWLLFVFSEALLFLCWHVLLVTGRKSCMCSHFHFVDIHFSVPSFLPGCCWVFLLLFCLLLLLLSAWNNWGILLLHPLFIIALAAMIPLLYLSGCFRACTIYSCYCVFSWTVTHQRQNNSFTSIVHFPSLILYTNGIHFTFAYIIKIHNMPWLLLL